MSAYIDGTRVLLQKFFPAQVAYAAPPDKVPTVQDICSYAPRRVTT